MESAACRYEIHVKHAKEQLVKQIKELRSKDQLSEAILTALSTDEQVPEILQRLRKGETYDSIVEWLERAPTSPDGTITSREATVDSHRDTSDQEAGRHAFTNRPSPSHTSQSPWTSLTNTNAILDHLFQLYFAWVHPVHTIFDEGYFVRDYRAYSGPFCSAILVHAICAMACHLHTPSDSDEMDYDTLGNNFTEFVRANLNPNDNSCANIQAFAIMFLVDCARGKSLRGARYLEMAHQGLSSVVMLNTPGFSDVLRTTSSGIGILSM